jgi:uncharacterized membrane protein YsdA (DUF1294 family)
MAKRGPTSSTNRRRKPTRSWDSWLLFSIVTFGLALVLAAALWWLIDPLDPLASWLIAITLITFLTYGYDKAIAGSGRTRVPEKVLLALTFAGGTLGALVAMPVFHHKTAKGAFRLKFWLVVVVQIAVIAVYYALIRRRFSGG